MKGYRLLFPRQDWSFHPRRASSCGPGSAGSGPLNPKPEGTRGERRRYPKMDHACLHDEPSKVLAEEGEVMVDGPDGVAVSLTPEAAIETSHRLLDGGLQAQGQKVAKRRQDRERRPQP